jgi:hypothetical protein
MDSDDILEADALQFLVETIEKNELDCVFFGGKTFFESEELKRDNGGFDNYYQYRTCCGKPMSGLELFTLLVREKEYRVSPCMQLVSADLVRDNGISFYEGIIYEDNLYTMQVILNAKRCMAVSEQFYLRRVREESTMTSKIAVGNVLGYLVCYVESLGIVDKFDMSGVQYEAICAVQDILIYHVQKYFNDISPDERMWIPAFCTGAQRSVYKTLVKLFPAKTKAAAPAPINAQVNKRLNDHDTALRNAQEELTKNRIRLNDHDTALRYAQETLMINRDRLNDHDTALGYLQQEMIQVNNRITGLQNSRSWKIGRLITWLPRKIKRLFRKG